MTPQSSFMIGAEVLPDRLYDLRALLAGMNTRPGVADAENPLLPFARLERLHFARLLVVELETGEDIMRHGLEPRPWPPTLYFLGDCDGPAETFLADLVDQAGPGLERIFSHCRDFTATPGRILSWLLSRNIGPAANYINTVGRTVRQAREESALHAALRRRVRQLQADGALPPAETLQPALRAWTEEEIRNGALTLSEPEPTPAAWWIRNQCHRLGVPLLLLLAAPVLLAGALPALILLRIYERSDAEITPRPDDDRIARLAESEDHLVTNQFSAFGDVKPGLFRRGLIVSFLFLLDYAARHVYNRGFLTRVKTIHFARWVLLDGKRRVLFASNYDGDLESYMDDFINKVGWGLNLVFSNGVGWPRTRWLVKGGAEHEQKFKYYLRRHQVHTDVWYKACPDLSADDLERNSRLRKWLFDERATSAESLQEGLDLI